MSGLLTCDEMEPVTAPLRLISRKFLKPHSSKKPSFGKNSIRQKWLTPTVWPNGVVLPAYRPMLGALQAAHSKTQEIAQFRAALKAQDHSKASMLWNSLRVVEGKVENISDWKHLARDLGSYGPRIFANALNDIVRHNRNKTLVKTLVSPSNSVLDPFILGTVTSKIAKLDIELAIELVSQNGWKDISKTLGIVALLNIDLSLKMVSALMQSTNFPQYFKLPNRLVAKLCDLRKSNIKEFVDTFQLLADKDMLPLSKPLDRLLRLVYSSSDQGSEAVRKYAMEQQLPSSFYPFLVKRLCEKLNLGDKKAQAELDFLFDRRIAEMASDKPSLVLHLLVMRIIATDGVQATSAVLNRWVECDPRGVSEPTWMLLFQAFRRMGRPDKCNEVLHRILETGSKLSLPFVGEYLMYAAQFFNIHEFLTRAKRVLPELNALFDLLGITEAAASFPNPQEEPLVSSPLALDADIREFFVGRIHESWLSITYQAVLSNVEGLDLALSLFDKYAEYVSKISNTPVSLRAVDQFVALLCTLPNGGVDAAESVYKEALVRFKIKVPADGKNHSKSLEALTFKLVQRQDLEEALRLLVFAKQHGQQIHLTTVKSWLKRLPPATKLRLSQWLETHAGVVCANLNAEVPALGHGGLISS